MLTAMNKRGEIESLCVVAAFVKGLNKICSVWLLSGRNISKCDDTAQLSAKGDR